MLICVVAIVSGFAGSGAIGASPELQWQLRDAADAAMSRGDHDAAIEALRRLVTLNPDRGSDWRDLADRCLLTQRYEESIAAYERAIALHFYPGEAMYNVACIHARSGRNDAALDWLERSIAARFNESHDLMRTDPDLDPLRDDARFRDMIRDRAPEDLSRDEGWRYDLESLSALVKRFHYDFDHTLPESAFDAMLDDLHARIPHIDDGIIYAHLFRIMASLEDAHSGLHSREQVGLRYFPLALAPLNDGLYVLAANERYAATLGGRIVAINDLPIEEVLQRMRSLVRNDAGNLSSERTETCGNLRIADFQVVAGVADQTDRMKLALSMPDGTTADVEVQSTERASASLSDMQRVVDDSPPPPLLFRNPGKPYWHEVIDDGRVVYCQIDACRDAARGPSLAVFTASLFDDVLDDGIDALILDIRHNGGGSSDLIWPFVRRIAHHPRLNDPQRLYVITGPRTGSAAALFTSYLEYHARPTFVGLPPNEPPSFIGEGAMMTLPWSGLQFSVSTRFFQAIAGTRDVRTWVGPHIRIDRTLQDVIERRDPVLETIQRRVARLRE